MGGRERGFTLIEVVVAFVMLTLVLAVGFEIFTTGFKRAGELESYSRALILAQSRLDLAGADAPYAAGEESGETEDRQFRWTVVTTPTDEGGAEPGKPPQSAFMLYRVDVRVDWRGADGRPQSLALATLGLGPKP